MLQTCAFLALLMTLPIMSLDNVTDLRISLNLDDAPHYDTNSEMNISRYTCHKMCHKRDTAMFK